MIYPATSNNKNWKILNTHSSYYSKEYADRACKLYISDEFAETNTGKKHKYFRASVMEALCCPKYSLQAFPAQTGTESD